MLVRACAGVARFALLPAMFTGIIEETGTVVRIERGRTSIRLAVRLALCARGLKPGDSLAVNGCCLTMLKSASSGNRKVAEFDLLRETWERTNLQFVRPGSLVNLERALRAGGSISGHFVTGHVDGLGTISRWEQKGRDYVLDIRSPSDVMRYVVFKGSIAVDGISLTVAEVRKRMFRVWIIPHTRQVTALRNREKGDAVNLEADLLAKYVEKIAGCGVP